MKPAWLSGARRARFTLLLVPVMLAGCYVVPIVPGHHRPVYERSDHPPPHRDHRHRDRDHHHWRGELSAAPQLAVVTPQSGEATAHAVAFDQSAASSIAR